MRTAVKAIIYLAVSLLLFFVIRAVLPKYQWMMGYVLALWLLDAYLWISAGQRINRMPLLPAMLLRFLYWLPFILVIACVIYGHFHSFLKWNIVLRTEVLNIIL